MTLGLVDARDVDEWMASREHWIFLTTESRGVAAFEAIEDAVIDPEATTTTAMRADGACLLFVKKRILPVDQLQLLMKRLFCIDLSRQALEAKDVFILVDPEPCD